MATETTFACQYFIDQCLELRERWATEEFWQKEGCCETALKGLGYIYLRLNKDDQTSISWLWEATTQELSRRHQLMLALWCGGGAA